MPDVENSRKTAEEGAEWGHGKTAEKQPEKQLKPRKKKTAVLTVFRVFVCFPAVFRLLYRDPLGTLFGCFQCRAFGTSVGGRRD